MNKKSLLSLLLFAATTVLSFATVHIMPLITSDKWVGVSVAIPTFVLATIVLLVINKVIEKYTTVAQCITLAVNAIADGMAISSLFMHLGTFPEIWQTALAAAGLIAAYALYLAITYIPFARKHYIISMTIYALIVIGAVSTWCGLATGATKAMSVLTILYLIIFVAFFIPLADNARCAKEHVKTVAYFSFAGLIIAIIVLAIMSDGGDLPLDGFADVNAASSAKKRNPYAYAPYDYAAFAAAASSDISNAKYGAPPENNDTPPLKPLL
ncbi:MAG: hypothetical protein K2F90_02240 [Clostridiales bacterium]|nr:hypothetical protein [Clostridiales bacterium]